MTGGVKGFFLLIHMTSNESDSMIGYNYISRNVHFHLIFLHRYAFNLTVDSTMIQNYTFL